MTVHDQVLVALISTIGSIAVAYLTTHQSSKPSKYDELEKENKELKRKLKEEKNDKKAGKRTRKVKY